VININTNNKTFFNIRCDILICFFLVVATLAVYFQVKSHEFVNFDDELYITKNLHLQSGLTYEGIVWSFTATRAGNWHPITWLSHMLDVQLYGMDPGRHHMTNVFFHILNTLLLFFIFKRMTGNIWKSGFIAALFSLHPLHVESVAWAAERKDVLSAFFWMLTMLYYIRYVESPGAKRYLIFFLFYVLGLMAKPMLVTLPFVFLLLDYWPLGRIHAGISLIPSFFRLILEKIPLFILAAISSVVTFLVQQKGRAVETLDMIPLIDRFTNALVSYVSYIGKMIWPQNLVVFYPHPGKLPIWQVTGACLLLISIFLLIIKLRQKPWHTVGWLWFFGTLVPVIGLVQVGGQAMADRYTYIPLIGLFVVISWGVPELLGRWRYRDAVLAISAGIVISAFVAISYRQVQYWKNSITILKHTINHTDNNWFAHNNLGHAFWVHGREEEAISQYLIVLRTYPYSEIAHNNLGAAYISQRQYDKAVDHFSKALRINPDYADAHNNLAVVLASQGKFKKAIMHYSEALRIRPDYANAHNKLGEIYMKQGKTADAIKHFSAALRINPGIAKAYNYLGVILAQKGKTKEAIILFKEAIRINPDYAQAQKNLEKVLATRRKVK